VPSRSLHEFTNQSRRANGRTYREIERSLCTRATHPLRHTAEFTAGFPANRRFLDRLEHRLPHGFLVVPSPVTSSVAGKGAEMRIKTSFLALFVGLTIASRTYADPVTLVNTGPSGPIGRAIADWQDEWFAAEFPVQSGATITTVEGWVVPFGPDPLGNPRFGGPVRLGLLSDAGGLPGNLLFSTVTSVPGAGPAQWIGASALNWSLERGNYWLSFEPLSHLMSGPAFSGAMFGVGGSPSAPLQREAFAILQSNCNFRDRSCWVWEAASDIFPAGLGLGVRIRADVASPTPEPDSLTLLGLTVLMYGMVAGRAELKRSRHASDRMLS
jgi:hypothetical protein